MLQCKSISKQLVQLRSLLFEQLGNHKLKTVKFKIGVFLIILFVFEAFPKSMSGKVIAVVDGDTFVLIDSLKIQHKVKLSGIDAPEMTQDYGVQAKLYLTNMIFGHHIKVRYTTKDEYNRVLGLVHVDSKNVNEEILKKGMAWAYLQDLDRSNLHYKELMEVAQNQRVGLWSIPNSMPPWDFRHSR